MTPYVTRFAPSPTGYLHLGHAFSAVFAARCATQTPGGSFLLRLEDIDQGRCRPEFAEAILEDLAWLGLRWEEPVRRQSEHMADYSAALERLQSQGLLYPCFCTRTDIAAEIDRLGQAPHGPDGPIYPGLCRSLTGEERAQRVKAGEAYALRLDVSKAMEKAGELTWQDLDRGEQTARPEMFGDVVLARKDCPTSYHLAVTVDDHLQGVTLVTRGEDLFAATHVHRLLQALLGLNVPMWRHHGLLTTPEGRRLAKRDQSLTLRALRQSGCSATDVLRMAQGEVV
ncbi:MAG: tRNA glutamyl-Q(34) synthetase GluQRS [Alphaproteobacteria bacterium RIFOXYD12_FULL_60_8]|nr:MAG: tRNA glutamyl-Q(34) synthetase GluQRS [Alphaproteobacteria bacterium RIFOXYD12_FULL_60_8]